MILLSEYISSEGSREAHIQTNVNRTGYYVFYYTHLNKLDFIKCFVTLDEAEQACEYWVN
jgi:hypothetical protein